MKTKYKPGDVLERWDGRLIVIEKLLFIYGTYRVFVINSQGMIIYDGSYTESEIDMFAAKKIGI